MSQILHSIRVPKGAVNFLARTDTLLVASLPGQANAAGGAAGASVSTTISLISGLPANYTVTVNPGQDATWYVSNKTANGFTVVLTPRLAANTLAAGTFDVLVIA